LNRPLLTDIFSTPVLQFHISIENFVNKIAGTEYFITKTFYSLYWTLSLYFFRNLALYCKETRHIRSCFSGTNITKQSLNGPTSKPTIRYHRVWSMPENIDTSEWYRLIRYCAILHTWHPRVITWYVHSFSVPAAFSGQRQVKWRVHSARCISVFL